MKYFLLILLLVSSTKLYSQEKLNSAGKVYTFSSIANDDSTKIVDYTVEYLENGKAEIKKSIRSINENSVAASYALFESGSYALILDPERGQFIQLKKTSFDNYYYLIPFNKQNSDSLKILETVLQKIFLDCDCTRPSDKRFVTYNNDTNGYLTLQCADYSYVTDPRCKLKFHATVYDFTGNFILIPATSISIK